MKKLILLTLAVIIASVACSAGPEYPDEDAIRRNAKKAHRNLKKAEKRLK